jgi:hypothetical protein
MRSNQNSKFSNWFHHFNFRGKNMNWILQSLIWVCDHGFVSQFCDITFWEMFLKISQIYSKNTKFSKIFSNFLLMWWGVNNNGYWKKDLVRKITMKQKGLNQMKRLSYDTKYQNGHAMSLESLNKMPSSLRILG